MRNERGCYIQRLTRLAMTDVSNQNQFNSLGGTAVFSSGVHAFAVGLGLIVNNPAPLLWATADVADNIFLFSSPADVARIASATQIVNATACS